MTLPTTTVTGHYEDGAKRPLRGGVTFTPSVPTDSIADSTRVLPAPVGVLLDTSGDFSIDLIATDASDLLPLGWTWTINERVVGYTAEPWSTLIPTSVDPIDISTLSPLETPPELVSYVLLTSVGQVGGPAGPLDSSGLIPSAQIPGGGGGGGGASPSGTVTDGTSFAVTKAVGSSAAFSRGDHAHGTPVAPTAASVGADASGAAAAALVTAKAYTDTETTRATSAESTLTTNVAAKPSLTASAATTSALGDAAAAGSAVTAARGDHVHGREAFGAVTAQTTYGGSSANGAAVTPARSDHQHGTVALTSSTPTTSALADAAAVGTGTSPARSDHVHGRESFGTATAQTSFGASSGNGAAVTPARSDHTHGTPSLSSSAATSSAVADAAAVGTGTTAARADHVHGREAFGNVTALTAFGTASANGSAATEARSDHVHGAPTLPGPTAIDQGLAAWTYDLALSTTGQQFVSGTLYLFRVKITDTRNVSTIYWDNTTAATSLTAGQNWVGLYDSTGALLNSVGTDAKGTIGFQNAVIGTTAVTPGFYCIAMVWNGTTPPKVSGSTLSGGTYVSAGSTAPTGRFVVNGTAVTTLPAPITLASNTFAGSLIPGIGIG